MKIYIVKYCANEYDDLGYDTPYPIFYSLDKKKARDFFEEQRECSIEHFNDFMKNHPEYNHNEDYQITVNDNDDFEYSIGNWFYQYKYEEQEIDKDLRYG